MYESQKKYMKNNLVKLGIDVKPETREEFKKACELNGTNAAKVLKDFINNYIEKNRKKHNAKQSGQDEYLLSNK